MCEDHVGDCSAEVDLVTHREVGDGWRERLHDEVGGVVGVGDDVDLLAAQLRDDLTHPGATRAHARADRVRQVVRRDRAAVASLFRFKQPIRINLRMSLSRWNFSCAIGPERALVGRGSGVNQSEGKTPVITGL